MIGLGSPRAFSILRIAIAEAVALMLASITTAMVVSNYATDAQSSAASCDLGVWGWTPYVAHNDTLYCGMNPLAAVVTGTYFLVAAIVIGLAHMFYRSGRKRIRTNPWSARHRWGTIAGFWIVALVWMFGLEGRRGNFEVLSTASYGKILAISVGLAMCHALSIYTRYRAANRSDAEVAADVDRAEKIRDEVFGRLHR